MQCIIHMYSRLKDLFLNYPVSEGKRVLTSERHSKNKEDQKISAETYSTFLICRFCSDWTVMLSLPSFKKSSGTSTCVIYEASVSKIWTSKSGNNCFLWAFPGCSGRFLFPLNDICCGLREQERSRDNNVSLLSHIFSASWSTTQLPADSIIYAMWKSDLRFFCFQTSAAILKPSWY